MKRTDGAFVDDILIAASRIFVEGALPIIRSLICSSITMSSNMPVRPE